MKKILTIIFDGFGMKESDYGNAIINANMVNFNKFYNENPHTTLFASGHYVGLHDGQFGNSEIGHQTIGAGRLIKSREVLTDEYLDNLYLNEDENIQKLKGLTSKTIHLMGLASDGNVHAGIDDFIKMYEYLIKIGFTKIFFHLITDGRDTDSKATYNYISLIEKNIQKNKVGCIASICGRYYAMDRDKRYERIFEAYNLYTKGIGEKCEKYLEKIQENYYNNITDEFMKPILVNSTGLIEKEDAVIFYNYRPDRAREITRAFIDPEFKEFERPYLNLYYTGMTIYDETLKNIHTIIKNEEIKNTLGEVIANHGLKQLRIAETEKYAHVTFFFNGGVEKKYNQEDRILVNSPKDVKTYDLKPEMSAFEVTKNLISALKSNKYDLIILNFANPDMVGHTGNLEATIKAIETIDNCMEDILKEVLSNDYTMIVTADHGNSECMINPDGSINTAHTTNLVPLSIVNYQESITLNKGKLSDIAPTILDIMNIEKPVEMTGVSLIK